MPDIVERLRALSNSIGDEAADIIEVHSNSIDALVDGWNNDRAELIRLRSERVAVPEGWRLVPLAPTDGMIHAGRCEMAKINNDDDYEQAQACYRAMLAASPQPPTDTVSETPAVCSHGSRTLSFSTRDADGVLVLDFAGGGCRPASDKEVELLTEIERLRAERDEAIAAARHLKNLVTSPLTEEDKEWARETMSDTNLARMPRDLATILRTEARNQRTPPIDYAVAEDGGRMVVHPEPDIAMAELLEEAATALAAKDAELAEVRQLYVDANEARIDAEAALAEARKALAALDRMSRGVDWCDQDEQARRWSAARRALEGGQEDD